MVALVKAKYTGPGADNYAGKVYPGQLTMLDQIENFARTPQGTAPPSGRQFQQQEYGGLLVLGPNADPSAGPAPNVSYLYDSRLTPATMALYDFSDPNCFPLATSATSADQAIPNTEVISDLVTYVNGDQSMGANKATPYPNGTSAGSSVALNYSLSPLSAPGIVRTGIHLNAAGQAISFSPTTNTPPVFPHAQVQSTDCMWVVAFETPAALAASATETAIFTIGQSMAALQFGLTVLNGSLNCYVNGAIAASAITALAVSTRYVVTVRFIAVDPNNPFNYIVEIYVNFNKVAVKSLPWAPDLTPWTFVKGTTQLRAITAGDGTCQFGPSAAFGSLAWDFLALAYIFEDYTPGLPAGLLLSNTTGISLDNSTPTAWVNRMTEITNSFGIIHAI